MQPYSKKKNVNGKRWRQYLYSNLMGYLGGKRDKGMKNIGFSIAVCSASRTGEVIQREDLIPVSHCVSESDFLRK